MTAIRSEALDDFLQFVGLRDEEQALGVESYSQRTVLAYIGLRIFQDQPDARRRLAALVPPEVFEPYVEDARDRFPDVDPLAFPAAGREWGVQNLYIQMLADAGVVGLVLLLALGLGGLVLAWRAAGVRARTRGRPAPGSRWSARCSRSAACGPRSGSSPGIPLQAATSLVLGLAAAGAAAAEEQTAV